MDPLSISSTHCRQQKALDGTALHANRVADSQLAVTPSHNDRESRHRIIRRSMPLSVCLSVGNGES